MIKTVLKVLIASSVSAVVVFGSNADAAGKRRVFGYSASPVVVKTGVRRTLVRRTKVHLTRRVAGPRVFRPRLVHKHKFRPKFVGRRFVRPRFVARHAFGPRYVASGHVAPRPVAPRYHPPRLAIVAVPAQAAEPKPTTEDLMAGICNGAGGGASTGSDGKVHCIDPDGNEVLDPVPIPD